MTNLDSENGPLQSVIKEYLLACDSGEHPSREELLRAHPGIASDLQEFFLKTDRGEHFQADAEKTKPKAADPMQSTAATIAPVGNGEKETSLSPHADPRADTLATKKPLDGFDSQASTLLPSDLPAPFSADTLASGGQSDSVVTAGPNSRVQQQLGDYELIEQIGRGGMGVVFRAKQVSLDRTVAIKMIRSGELASRREIERFQIEAEAAAELDHPGIVPIFEVGESKGTHFFSMAYVGGQSLAGKLKEGPMTPRAAAEMTLQLANAVAYAHERGVIHRDLKPDNVLLDKDGQPRITDFGLAKRIDTDVEQTRTGEILGTPGYMPPEQASGKTKEIGRPADVYGLGAVLYAMLTVRPPFQAATQMDTLRQVLEKEPVAPRQMDSGIPRDLETICLKCLQKPQDKRYSSAAALAEDLQRFVQGKPIQARPVGIVEHGWMWCKRNPWIAVPSAAAAMLAMVLMIGGPILAANFYQEKNTAQTNEKKAIKNADLAVDSSRSVLNRIYEVYLRDPNRDRELMKKMLQIALASAEGISKNQESFSRADIALASAYKKFGEVSIDLGETLKAVEYFEESVRISKSLEAEGNLPDPNRYLALVYELLGDAKQRAGDLDGAESEYQFALQHLELRRKDRPQLDVAHVQTMARIYSRLAALARLGGDVAKSREYRVGVLKSRRDWVRVCPGESEPLRELASALKGVAFVDDKLSNQTKYMDEAIGLLRGLNKRTPVDPADRGNLPRFISAHAGFYLQGGDPKIATEKYAQAIAQLEELTGDDQEKAALQSFLAAAYYGMGIACDQLSDPKAKEFYGKGLEIRQAQFDRDNTKTKLACLMLVTARYGNHVQAKSYAERFGKAAKYPKDFYHLAALYALSSDVVEPGQQQLKAAYTVNALENLAMCIEKGYADVRELSTDPDLAPIRDLPGFADLLAKAQQKE